MTFFEKRTLLIAALSAISLIGYSQKDDVPKGWHMLDKTKDGYQGISIGQAYDFVKTKKLKSNTVIVAVIDSGVDTLHEDLKTILWKMQKKSRGMVSMMIKTAM